MEGQGQLDPDPAGEGEAAPMLKAVDLGQPAGSLLQPVADLVVGKHRGPRALGDRHRVADVIAVAVRDQDQVGRDLLGLGRRLGVSRQERIDQHVLAVAVEQQAGMTEPSNAC